MALTKAERARLKRAGLTKLNKPKMTPKHRTKKAIVATRVNGKLKIIRFGAQGMGHNYSPEARRSFKARHRKNIPEEEFHQHTGQISFYGLEKVVAQRDRQNHKNL
tara:strand:+ start:8664 stop:8981 length:318 start_codon:yes stop_codon:yes gene_type:complete